MPLGALDMVPADPFERALVEVDGAGQDGTKARGARVVRESRAAMGVSDVVVRVGRDRAAPRGAGAKALEQEPGSGPRRIPQSPVARGAIPPPATRSSLPPVPAAQARPAAAEVPRSERPTPARGTRSPTPQPIPAVRLSKDEVKTFEAASARFAAVPGTLSTPMDFEVQDRETKKLATDDPYAPIAAPVVPYDPPLVAAMQCGPHAALESFEAPPLGVVSPPDDDDADTDRLHALVLRPSRLRTALAATLLATGNATAWLADLLLRWGAALRT